MSLAEGDVLNRADKVAFMGLTLNATTFNRMKGFTDLGNSKNASTYDRRYVDERQERSDVTGYAPEKSYAFDDTKGDEVQEVFRSVADDELTGAAAKRPVVTVDFSKPVSGSDNTFEARKRVYTIIPDADGDSTDAYTYSGTLKAAETYVKGTATSSDNWETCSFTAEAGE